MPTQSRGHGTRRRDESGEMDFETIQQHIEAVIGNVQQMNDFATKASTVKKSGEAIEKLVGQIQKEMERRLQDVLDMLRA